jgi:serine/threonine protein kinase
MEKEMKKLIAKPLELTYEVYEQRNKSIKNYCIGNYVVYDLIGVGSFGSVYRGMNDDTKQQVGVKVIDMRKINQEKPLIKAIQLRLA